MTIEANIDLIQSFWQASERGDIDEMTAVWAPDAINHGGQTAQGQRQPPAGPEGLKRVFNSLLRAFPDRKYLIEDILATGDKAVCRLTVSGTHQGVPELPVEGGMLMTIPPTGKAYTTQQIHIFRIKHGKIAEHWAVRDDLGMMQQCSTVSPRCCSWIPEVWPKNPMLPQFVATFVPTISPAILARRVHDTSESGKEEEQTKWNVLYLLIKRKVFLVMALQSEKSLDQIDWKISIALLMETFPSFPDDNFTF